MRFISAKSSYKSKCSAKVPPDVPLNRHHRTQCRSRAYCIDTEPSEGWCLSGVVIRTAPEPSRKTSLLTRAWRHRSRPSWLSNMAAPICELAYSIPCACETTLYWPSSRFPGECKQLWTEQKLLEASSSEIVSKSWCDLKSVDRSLLIGRGLLSWQEKNANPQSAQVCDFFNFRFPGHVTCHALMITMETFQCTVYCWRLSLYHGDPFSHLGSIQRSLSSAILNEVICWPISFDIMITCNRDSYTYIQMYIYL